jgi:hypothetical protein
MTQYKKYPRTFHMPGSNCTNDDKMVQSMSHFYGKYIVVTLKMDGECSTLYKDYMHARSINSKDYISRHYLKNLHSMIKIRINERHKICGENMYAKHTIHYKNLDSFFYGFSVWSIASDICLSWNFTKRVIQKLGLTLVPIMYEGIYNEKIINALKRIKFYNNDPVEGFVIRKTGHFKRDEFKTSVAKFVHKEFSNSISSDHWMSNSIIKNQLKTV